MLISFYNMTEGVDNVATKNDASIQCLLSSKKVLINNNKQANTTL